MNFRFKIALRAAGLPASLFNRVRIWWNWQTRYFEVVVGQPVQVQVLLSAPASKMKQMIFLSLLALLLTGCASHYVVTLTNGYRLVAADKPHLEGFNFVFTDLKGRTNSIPSTRVRAVTPVSGQGPSK